MTNGVVVSKDDLIGDEFLDDDIDGTEYCAGTEKVYHRKNPFKGQRIDEKRYKETKRSKRQGKPLY